MLVVCAEFGIPQDPLAEVMVETVRALDSMLADAGEFS